jgi:hypothetical protein
MLRAGLFIGGGMTIFTILLHWWVSTFSWSNSGVLLGGAILAVLLAIGLSVLAAVSAISYGIEITDDGVRVLERTLIPGRHISRLIVWEDLCGFYFEGGVFSIRVRGDRAIKVTYEQARTVLTDARCPLRKLIPPKIAKVIGTPPTWQD